MKTNLKLAVVEWSEVDRVEDVSGFPRVFYYQSVFQGVLLPDGSIVARKCKESRVRVDASVKARYRVRLLEIELSSKKSAVIRAYLKQEQILKQAKERFESLCSPFWDVIHQIPRE